MQIIGEINRVLRATGCTPLQVFALLHESHNGTRVTYTCTSNQHKHVLVHVNQGKVISIWKQRNTALPCIIDNYGVGRHNVDSVFDSKRNSQQFFVGR